MEKIHEEMVEKWSELNDMLKDRICDLMRGLGIVRLRRAPRILFNKSEEYKKIPVWKLEYNEETNDVIAYEEDGDEGFYECSVQEEGTIDGCLDLLWWLEQGKFEIAKKGGWHENIYRNQPIEV